jgi:hypothetical protein
MTKNKVILESKKEILLGFLHSILNKNLFGFLNLQ